MLDPERTAELAMCSRPTYGGAVDFITKFCRTQDEFGRIAPIPNWPFVRNLIWCYHSDQDSQIVKSRQMLGTWVGCAYFLWAMLFVPGFAGFMTSRKQQLVDDGGENSSIFSLMGRLRSLYHNLPKHLRRHVNFRNLRIDCPGNRSFIVGESANPDMGRGGTFTTALCDEWSRVPNSEACFGSLRSAVKSMKQIATPYGMTGNFARVHKSRDADWLFYDLHWSQHPDRSVGLEKVGGKLSSPWYKKARKMMTDSQAARELDLSFALSVAGMVYSCFDYQVVVSNKAVYNPRLPLRLGLDFGIGAATAGGFFQVVGDEMWLLRDYERQGLSAPQHAASLIDIATREIGYQGALEDIICYGDPAGNAREIGSGSTVIDYYVAAGLRNFITQQSKVLDGIELVRLLMEQNRFFVHPDCNVFIDRVPDYIFPTDDEENVRGDNPVKNKATHIMDGIRYGAINCFSIPGTSISLSSVNPGVEALPFIHQEAYEPVDETRGGFARPIAAPYGMEF